MKALNILLALAVSLLIGVLVFEGGLRLLGLGPPVQLVRFDETLGWSKNPDLSVTRGTAEGFKVDFSFNAHGLREDADVTPAKPAGVHRVIALGDSFTLGVTVDRSDLFLDILEDWWNAEGRSVQIVNTGTEGYSTDQEVAWLAANGEAWSPDLILLFAYENDIYWNGQTRYTEFDKPRYGPDGTLETRELEPPPPLGWVENSAIGRLLLGGPDQSVDEFTPGTVALPREFSALLETPPAWFADPLARTRGALQALAAQARALNARVVVVPIPSHSAIDPAFRKSFQAGMGLDGVAWSPDRPVDLMLDAAREVGLATLDVRPALRARAKDGVDLYFNRDWHLNPEGNRVLAAALHDGLEALSDLPAGTGSLAQPEPTPPGGLPGWLPWLAGLWIVLGSLYARTYRSDESPLAGFLKVGLMLSVIFTIALGGTHLIGLLPPTMARLALVGLVVVILGFVAYKLGNRMGTVVELLRAFIGRGHWYLMPLVTILLTVGSLLVVAASSPLVAPFIYTLF